MANIPQILGVDVGVAGLGDECTIVCMGQVFRGVLVAADLKFETASAQSFGDSFVTSIPTGRVTMNAQIRITKTESIDVVDARALQDQIAESVNRNRGKRRIDLEGSDR